MRSSRKSIHDSYRSHDESSDGNSTPLFPFELFLPENNFFSFSFFPHLSAPIYRHLSRRIDYAKIIFFNNQRIGSGAHPVPTTPSSEKRVVGSVATSEWIARRQSSPTRKSHFSYGREKRFLLLVDSTDSREGSSRKTRGRGRRGIEYPRLDIVPP